MEDDLYDPYNVLNQLADFANNQVTMNHAHQGQISNMMTFISQCNAQMLLLSQRLNEAEHRLSVLEKNQTH